MTKSSNKKIFMWVGLLGVAGIGIYEYLQQKKSTTSELPATPPTSTAVSDQIMTSLPGTLPVNNPTAPPSSGAIPAIEVSTVQNWAAADGRPPVLAMATAMVPQEYDGMYAIIQGWDSTPPGQTFKPTDEQSTFWNNLRDKYDPTHIYW